MDCDFGFEFSDCWAYSVDVSALSIELKNDQAPTAFNLRDWAELVNDPAENLPGIPS